MKTHFTFSILCLTLLLACKSYEPFLNKKEKQASVMLIKNKIELTTKEFNTIKKNDSVLYSVSNAIKGNVKSSLIKRRIDSFLLKNYNQKELFLILKLDSLFPNERVPYEVDRRKGVKRLEFNDAKELKEFMKGGGLEKKLDSVLGMKKTDSTKKKKH